jgi:hypothetical protein
MLQTSLVAFATPDGNFQIAPAFEQLSECPHAEAVDNDHRLNVAIMVTEQMTNTFVQASKAGGRSMQSTPQTHPVKKRKSPRRRYI